MAEARHVAVVRKKLQDYAHRGVIRHLRESKGRDGKVVFTFEWLLDWTFTLVFDRKRDNLQFKDLLPNVHKNSDMYTAIKGYFAERIHDGLRPHRRIDPEKAELKFLNRKSKVSVILKVHENQYQNGVTTLLNITNELFGFLHMYYLPYLWDEFDVPQE